MLGELAKRLVNMVVVLLAAVTFFLVPFGRRTLFQHFAAIFRTHEAAELGREVENRGRQVVEEVERTVGSASGEPRRTGGEAEDPIERPKEPKTTLAK